ncbi:MAG: hypothetical protein ACYCZF_08350 [Anaerolineae bacterium]
MRWWQPLVFLLTLYVLASVTPWLVVAALSWSLRHSYRSLASVISYLDKLQYKLTELSAWWPVQPRFGPYSSPVQQSEVLLTLLEEQLAAAAHLAQPLRSASLPEFTVFSVLALRCWAALRPISNTWSTVRRLAQSLAAITDYFDRLRVFQHIVENIPSDVQAQLDLRQYEAEQFGAILKAELAAGTTGLDQAQARILALIEEIKSLREYLDQNPDPGEDSLAAITETSAAISTDIADLTSALAQTTQLRQQAQTSLDQAASLAISLRDRWHAVLRQGLRSQPIDERLIGLCSQLEEAQARLLPHSCEAYRAVIAATADLIELANALANEIAGYEQDIAQADAALNSAAADLKAGKEAISNLHTQFMNIEADTSSDMLDMAEGLLASAHEQRRLGSLAGVHQAIELAQQVRDQMATIQANVAGLEGRVREVYAIWIALKRGDTSSWEKQAQFVIEKLQGYPKHYVAATDLVRNIELSIREASLALSCLPDELVKTAYFKESQLENASDALTYAQRCLEYIAEGIVQGRAALEHIEKQRLVLEQDVAMLLYVDLTGVEQLMGAMLPELRERFLQTALSIRQEAANLLDPAKTEYDEALRFSMPFLHKQLDEVRAAHATHIKQAQLQYEAEKGPLTRSWAQLERVEPAQFQYVASAYTQLQDEYRSWQQTADGNQQNPLVLSQTLGRRSIDLLQRMQDMLRSVVEGRLALRELEKAFQQRSAQAETMRTRLEQLGKSSSWPKLVWDSETDRAWAQIIEGQKRIGLADSLPGLLDAWQRAVSACNEAIRLCERYENQMHEALGRLQDEFRAVTALKQRVQRQAEELSARKKHTESRKLTKLVSQVEYLINSSKGETHFDAALRHLRQARDMLNRL